MAAQVLVNLGGSLNRVRDKVIELAPPGTGEGPELSVPFRRSRMGGPLDELMGRLEAMEYRLAAIERHLGLAGGQEPGGGQAPGGGEGPGGAEAGGAGR